MAPFYSRYVPNSGTSAAKPARISSPPPSKKRKLGDEQDGLGQDIKIRKKTIREQPRDVQKGVVRTKDSTDGSKKLFKSISDSSENISQEVGKVNGSLEAGDNGDESSVLQEQSVKVQKKKRRNAQRAQPKDEALNVSKTTQDPNQQGSEVDNGVKAESGKEKKKKRQKMKNVTETGSGDNAHTSTQQEQHGTLRSKFEKATKNTVRNAPRLEHETGQQQDEAPELPELHGLEPLPQPPPAPESDERPTFSSLPPWLANPLRADSGQSVDFSSLGLDSIVLQNVEKQGLEKTFPVQSAVIPILTDGPNRHRGDVCISAATGSGKTLAYVLPMVQHLKTLAATKLRGLIVVPTRELVRQARETCEACAAGTNVKIATAVGSKSLHDEQENLVETYQIYDPDEYKKQQNAPVDWSKVDLEDMLTELDNENEAVVDFVVQYRSKVDVLICTPGRLVDHMRYTKGFTLHDVQWLIIDEADRLLNESFQEWTEIVVPALQSRAAHILQDNILRHMRLEIPERIVQKVILSATMTQDISKLNSLKMRNPKLVVVGDVKAPADPETIDASAPEPPLDESSTFNLPSTLLEYAVPVGDGAEKPLYLLELLRTKVNVFDLDNAGGTRSGAAEDEDGTSTSDSSASDSDLDSISSSTSSSTSSSPYPPGTQKPKGSPEASTSQSSYQNTALIFTRSTSSATRLARLLSLLSTPIASLTATLTKSSSTSSSSSTRKALANFRNHKIRIIIATDRASRGLDLPGLGHVISYDVPTSMTTYVHRVGRTARADGRVARGLCSRIGRRGGFGG
ncbi:hypothetical protein GJ744_003303 [Endocarpon pusillum]|uniref:ATP-dependent RNA helicase n=1 Tax=Endocarpon pusillum TaxID=364733 RepID=A0A8H7AAY7_9EURO|nr:hypothetical protein GJ744_003303 [Endocarpon pusillum]